MARLRVKKCRKTSVTQKNRLLNFFSNEKGPAIFCRVFSLLTVKFL